MSEDAIEPGQAIGEARCPCCGALLEVEHGDEAGQIAVLGTPNPDADAAERELRDLCTEYLEAAENGECEDRLHKLEEPIFEAAMEACLGRGIFTRIIAAMARRGAPEASAIMLADWLTAGADAKAAEIDWRLMP